MKQPGAQLLLRQILRIFSSFDQNDFDSSTVQIDRRNETTDVCRGLRQSKFGKIKVFIERTDKKRLKDYLSINLKHDKLGGNVPTCQ